MADDAPLPESETEEGGTTAADSARLQEVWETALTEFDAVAIPQIQLRAESLEDRRFTVVTGAMWEGQWGEDAENSPRPEIDKIRKSLDKIADDWNQNRVVVDYVPADDNADESTADTLDGMYRADCYHYNASQGRDNAMAEARGGGFGAYRMSTDYEDPSDPDNEKQRVVPGIMIPDADQSVYFYGGVNQDASDAESAFIITRDLMSIAKAKWGEENLTPFPASEWKFQWDWYTPETACIAEYYKVEKVDADRIILTNPLTEEEQRYYQDEIEPQAVKDLQAQGWKKRTRKAKRTRVHKYILNGTRVLKDCGYIAGEHIPIVPVYGNTEFVDGVRHWWGYTRKRKDRARILNTVIAHQVETSSMSPMARPVFAPEQMTEEIAEQWARANVDRLPYLLALPLRDENGGVINAGPIATVQPPQPSPADAQLLQLIMQEAADDEQNVDQIKSNTSYDSMDLAATRVDGKSAIYLDNGRLAVQREGVIYQSQARDVYFEEGRKVETRTEEGQDGTASLMEPHTDDNGVYRVRNDLSKGRYKVVATVQEATATRRQKTVKDSLALAEIMGKAGDPAMAKAAALTAMMNMDGENMSDLQAYARKEALTVGLAKPTKEEQAEIDKASQQQQQPSPADQALMAQTNELTSKAALNEAARIEKLASAGLKDAQRQAVGGPESAPEVPSGLDAPDHPNNVVSLIKDASTANLNDAKAEHLRHQMGHQTIKTGAELAQAEHQREMDRRAADRDDKASTAA